jgi:putative flippase GtrA
LAPLKIHYTIVLVISNVICVAFAYLTNKFLVFRTLGNYLREFSRFVAFHLSHLLLNLVAVPMLVELGGISPIVAQPAFAVVVVVTSYFWHRHITFARKWKQAEGIRSVATDT